MATKLWNGSGWADASGVFVWNGSGWARSRVRRWDGGQWADVNVYTVQYEAVETRSFNDGSYYDDVLGKRYYFNIWQSDTGLGQGSYSGTYEDYVATYGDFYGTMRFGSAPAALAGKSIIQARLRLTRYSDSPPSGSSAAVTTTIYATDLTDIPGSGAHTPHGEAPGSGITTAAISKGGTLWTDITALAQTVISGKCLCLYTGSGRLSRHYGTENTANKPMIEFTYY